MLEVGNLADQLVGRLPLSFEMGLQFHNTRPQTSALGDLLRQLLGTVPLFEQGGFDLVQPVRLPRQVFQLSGHRIPVGALF